MTGRRRRQRGTANGTAPSAPKPDPRPVVATDRLAHVTLNTGHVRMSPRAEVGPGMVERLTPYLRRALAGRRPALPEPATGYRLHAETDARGRQMVAEVTTAAGASVVSLAVCADDPDGAEWRACHDANRAHAPRGADLPDRLPPPWCAVRVHDTAPHDAMHWCGAFERCLAWTWVERWT